MRNLKKILALVLALMMVLSVMVTSSAAFEDADEIQHSEAVEVMSNLGILLGDGANFNPNGTLTRAQAAVIIAKMLEGSVDNISALVDAVDNPFTDVPAWALDYVLYAYSKGVVRGTSADKYTPNKNLTGYEFGKMVLVAAGICKDADFNNNWKMVVAEKLNKTGLLAGLSDLVLSKDLSREHAAQMAFNAMNYGTTTNFGYAVMCVGNDGVKETKDDYVMGYYPSLVEAATAATVLGAKYYYNPSATELPNGSLADTVFGLGKVGAQVGIGFRGYYWFVEGDGSKGYTDAEKDVIVSSFICTDKVVGTYTTANTWAEVSADLGKKANYPANGLLNGSSWFTGTEIDFDNKAKGTIVSDTDMTMTAVVRADADKTVEFLYAQEYLTIAVRGNMVKDKTSDNYGKYEWNFKHQTDKGAVISTVYGAADAYTNGAAYLVIPTRVPTVTPASAVMGKITAKGLGYIKVDGTTYTLSDLRVSATLGADAIVYLNTAGDVIYVGSAGEGPDTVYDGYVYVTALQFTATPYITTQLVGSGAEATITAKAIVTDVAGNTSVVDIATNVKKVNAYKYVPQYWLNGKFVDVVASENPDLDQYNKVVTVAGGTWMAYTVDENGAYKLDTMSTQTVTSATNYKAVVGLEQVDYYMDANTEIEFYYYNTDTGAVKNYSNVGYANYKNFNYMGEWVDTDNDGETDTWSGYEAVVTLIPGTNVIASITFYLEEVVTNYVDYAVYGDVIEETEDGKVYGFYIDGELKPFYAYSDLTATLTKGDVVDFQTDAYGVVTSASKTNMNYTDKVITYVAADGSYFKVEGETGLFYLDTYNGHVIFDAVNGYTEGELTVGQTVTFHKDTSRYDNGVDVIVIKAHPAE